MDVAWNADKAGVECAVADVFNNTVLLDLTDRLWFGLGIEGLLTGQLGTQCLMAWRLGVQLVLAWRLDFKVLLARRLNVQRLLTGCLNLLSSRQVL